MPRLIWTILLGGMLLGCQKDSGKAPTSDDAPAGTGDDRQRIILQLGEETVPFAWFDRFRQIFYNNNEFDISLDAAGSTVLLNQFVENQLLLLAARRAGTRLSDEELETISITFDTTSAEEASLRREELLGQKYLMSQLAGQVDVTEDEQRAYYYTHSGEFVVDDQYRVKEILVDSETLAKQIHEELLLGGKSRFDAYARQFSNAPSAANGGDLGYFQKDELPPEFEKIIFSLKPGRFSTVIRSQYGYHIFYLEEVIRRHAQKFYEVQEKIRTRLRVEKERRAHEQLISDLYQKYRPVIYENELDFQLDKDILDKSITLEESHAK
ncbi:MAG: peptidylprolyl isomerase [Acidobacteria bacterium]|nr:peptidylprolyl isomerase [Acidobacteriota bacterium]